jgi:osmotically-inducible protein OsmY
LICLKGSSLRTWQPLIWLNAPTGCEGRHDGIAGWKRLRPVMDDLSLRQRVMDELEFDPRIDAAHIGVSAQNGVVTLTGHVCSYAEKLALEAAVKRVKGVKAVAQETRVRYPFHRKTGDDEIAGRAVKILAWSLSLPEGAIQVKVERGWITLSGLVAWQFEKDAAEDAVKRLSGVHGVINLIEIRPRAQAGDIKKRIEDALARSAEIIGDRVRVQVQGDTVILDGTVRSWYERDLAQQAAFAAPGVRTVDDRLAIA